MKDKETAINSPRLTVVNRHGASGGAYGLGFIGAAVYFLQNSHTFGAGVLGILKALVWPVILIYHLFQFLAIK